MSDLQNPPLPRLPRDTAECACPMAEVAGALIHTRQTILPKRLVAPGPDTQQLETILEAAAAAPDHRMLLPWRFVIVPASARAALGAAFAQALLERDAAAEPDQVAQAREKAQRAPLLMLAVARLSGGDEEILPAERLLSAGAAIQNMLLMATALGFGSALTSGKALQAQGLRSLFGLADEEQALCFISIGTAHSRKPARVRPAVSDYVCILQPDRGHAGPEAAAASLSVPNAGPGEGEA